MRTRRNLLALVGLSSSPAGMQVNVGHSSGGGQAHNNNEPFVTLMAVISIQGTFAWRN